MECIRYTQDALQKNNQGGLYDDNPGQGKVVYIYASPNTQRDPIRLFKKYVSLQPKSDKPASCTSFYLRPLRKPTAKCWYGDQPYGKNNIGQVVKKIMEKAHIKGRWTNHSLRRTAASRLMAAKVEEKIVKEITGHKSDCVRMYQVTPDHLKYEACLALYGRNPKCLVSCDVQHPKVAPTSTANKSEDIDPPSTVCDNKLSGDNCNDKSVEININKSGPIAIVTEENYPNSNTDDREVSRIKCLSNHRSSPGLVRVCDLLHKKITKCVAPKNVSDIGVQVSENCQCQKKSTCDASIQTDKEPDVVPTKKMRFDISFSVNMDPN